MIGVFGPEQVPSPIWMPDDLYTTNARQFKALEDKGRKSYQVEGYCDTL
jgi:hypothetical protein